jgi:hypothetical protein
MGGYRPPSTVTIIFLNTTERRGMKTRVVTIYWDVEKDLTTYDWGTEFKSLHRIEKLDTLQDAIGDLSAEYDKELNNERR